MKTINLALVLAIVSAVTAVSVMPYWISPKNYTVGDDYGSRLENFVAPKGEWADVPAGIGARNSPSVHFDSKGILWIFGGSTDFGYLNAGWNYDLAADKFRWVAGSNQLGQLEPNFGTKGVESPNVFPGVVYVPSVIDSKDQIWMYTNPNQFFRWNTTSGNFVWLGENSTVPNIGTPGEPSAEAWPGLKDSPCMVVDSQDNIWLIGGAYKRVTTNTVWHYNTTSGYWTFVFGDPFNFTTNNYDENYFGGRYLLTCDIDENDLIWVHGGSGGDSNVVTYFGYGDLWTFDTKDKTWTVIQTDTINSLPVIDVRNEFSANNRPGARYYHGLVNRLDGTLMLYGGALFELPQYYDDIWLFDMTLKQWKIISGGINVTYPGVRPQHTNYRESGSILGYRVAYGVASGKTNKGQFVMVNGVDTGRQKDIWIIPQDVCGLGLGNCLPEATCVMEDWLYRCKCPDGKTGNGITSCDLPPQSPSAGTPGSKISSAVRDAVSGAVYAALLSLFMLVL